MQISYSVTLSDCRLNLAQCSYMADEQMESMRSQNEFCYPWISCFINVSLSVLIRKRDATTSYAYFKEFKIQPRKVWSW